MRAMQLKIEEQQSKLDEQHQKLDEIKSYVEPKEAEEMDWDKFSEIYGIQAESPDKSKTQTQQESTGVQTDEILPINSFYATQTNSETQTELIKKIDELKAHSISANSKA